MAKKLAVRAGGALKKSAKKSALKRSAKKVPAKKSAKKVPGKKSAKKMARSGSAEARVDGGGFHHLQRASAVISLLEGESGGDLRMLLEFGVMRYRDEADGAAGFLRAAEHLSMAGLYAARALHRLDVAEPSLWEVEGLIGRVGRRVDELDESDEDEFTGRLPLIAGELLGRAEAALDEDQHLAWELAMAADGICEGLER